MRGGRLGAFCVAVSMSPWSVGLGASEDSDPSARPAEWKSAAFASIRAAEYAIRRTGAGLEAPNRAHGFRVRFQERGTTLMPRGGDGGFRLTIGLAAIGRDELRPVDPVRPVLDGRRGSFVREGVVEWYENDRRGLEQGFSIERRAAGRGSLRLVVGVAGSLEARLAGDAVQLVDACGVVTLTYHDLVVVDANGDAVPAALRVPAADAIEIVIDDARAAYPIIVDPLTTAPDAVFEGNQENAEFGYSVATAGDVNDDGYVDVLVGAPYFDVVDDEPQTDDNRGAAFLFLGSAGGLLTEPAWTAFGTESLGEFGFCVRPAGDVDGDGRPDVLIGARYQSAGETKEGMAFVYRGTPGGLSDTPLWSAEGNQVGAGFGAAVAPAGDVDADGFGDVAIGAPYFDAATADAGAVFVFHGGPSGPSAVPDRTLFGPQKDSDFGVTVDTAGDANGDGYSDLIAGAPNASFGEDSEGAVFLFAGGPTGVGAVPIWIGDSNETFARFGAAVATAGDVNGDGFADVIVGAESHANGEFGEGGAFAFLGGVVVDPSPCWEDEGDQTFAGFGRAVAPAGDVNGDGFADVIVGAFKIDLGQMDEGAAYVYLGGRGTNGDLASEPSWIKEGDAAFTEFGHSVATAGDVNGDGFADVIIGAHLLASPELNEGGAFVYHGSPDGPAALPAWSRHGDQGGAALGTAVSIVGDVNGDGFADVIVGAPGFDAGEPDEGAAFLFLGGPGGPAGAAAAAFEGEQAGAGYGASLAGAGDVNGDGYADVIIGAPYFDAATADAGQAAIHLGTANGLAPIAAWLVHGEEASARLGTAVAAAGDVNGDGYGDVLVGVPGAGGPKKAGRVHLFIGSSIGPSPFPSWTRGGGDADELGAAIAGGGDVDGDGFADALLGAPGHEAAAGAGAGRVLLHRGDAQGLAPVTAWTADGAFAGEAFGAAVAFAGDVDGDGFADLAIGAPMASAGFVEEGRAALYAGGVVGPSATSWTATGGQTSARLGAALAAAGDANGDGRSDLLVGAPGHQDGESNEGRALLYLGGFDDLDPFPAWSADGDQTDANFGAAVATGGDVNGDGASDLLVGAPGLDGAGADVGGAFQFLGMDGGGVVLRPRQRTVADEPIAARGVSTDGAFVIALDGRAPFGRGRVRLEWDARAFGFPFDVGSPTVQVGDGWNDTDLAAVDLRGDVRDLLDGPYHWRARARFDPATTPYAAWGPWRSPPALGRTEAMLRSRRIGTPFVPGDRLRARLDGLDDATEGSFVGLSGMTLKLTFDPTPATSMILVSIVDPFGAVEKFWTIAVGPKKATKKKVVVEQTGTYAIHLRAIDGPTDWFEVQTARSLPSGAKSFHQTLKDKEGVGAVPLELLALAGATLDLVATPTKKFTGPTTVAVGMPGGTILDVTPFQDAIPNGGLHLSGVPLPVPGAYVLTIGSFSSKKEKLKVQVDLSQPPPGSAVVVLP